MNGQIKLQYYERPNGDRKRTYGKEFECYFCDPPKIVTNIRAHYFRKHKEEELVKQIQDCPPGSHDRKEKLDTLTKLGNNSHNLRVIQQQAGTLFLCRRPSRATKIEVEDYLPCSHCLGWFYKYDLYRHSTRCSVKNNDPIRHLIKEGRMIVNAAIGINHEKMRDVLSTARKDHVYDVILKDAIIKQYGAINLDAKGLKNKNDIVERMRCLARFVLLYQEGTSQKNLSLSKILQVENFENIVTVVKMATAYGDIDQIDTSKPRTLGIKIGQLLQDALNIIESNCISQKNDVKRAEVQSLRRLFEINWSKRVSIPAHIHNTNEHHLEDFEIPVAKDMLLLRDFLNKEMNEASYTLKENPTKDNWKRLCAVVLVRLILFNKRRGGEAQRITLNQYLSRPNWSSINNDDILRSLPELEQQLCKEWDLVKVTGKRRPVPVILPPEIKRNIDLLVQERDNAGIKSSFLFANPDSLADNQNPMRSWDLVKEFSIKAGVSRPDIMTSTNFRKYVATVAQIVSLSENEMEWLCNHMGHRIDVHRQFYRLPTAALELSKVSKLLIAAESGKVHQLAGQSLVNIPVTIETSTSANVNPSETEGSISLEAESIPDSTSSHSSSNSDTASVRRASINDQIDSLDSPRPKKRKFERAPWPIDLKNQILADMKNHILERTTPGKKEITSYIAEHNLEIDWLRMKNLIKNSWIKKD